MFNASALPAARPGLAEILRRGGLWAADLLTNGGKAVTTYLVVNGSTSGVNAPPKYVMWGTGSGQTATSTALAAAAAPTTATAVTGTITQETTTVTNDTVRAVGTVTAGGSLAITEAATTTNATIASGAMFQYGDFSVINVGNGDSIAFTFNMKYS